MQRVSIKQGWRRGLWVLLALVIAALGTSLAVGQLASMSDVQAMIARLRSTPALINMDTDAVNEIFQRGQALGNRANVFTTVGDSNTTNGDFLYPIGLPDEPCTWGDYADLQQTVDFFSVPPLETSLNSFTHRSLAAAEGFGSATVLDPFWANSALCEPDELPLVCEYRLTQPSVAVIMLGQMNINRVQMDAETYRANMERIIQLSQEHGVIPVLTTIVFLRGRDVWRQSMEYNMVLLDLAEAYPTPLINLWMAVQTLPDQGIGPDHSHLKAEAGSYCAFDGAERELGGTLRNLLTLQALDDLRRGVLAR